MIRNNRKSRRHDQDDDANSEGVKDDKKEVKHDMKMDKISSKKGAKADLIDAKARKAEAVAKKRKWLVFLIGIAIAAYYAIKGGMGGGLLQGLKTKLGI